MNANRERIQLYVKNNPDATMREIMAACRISSTSVVSHHLKALRHGKKDFAVLAAENDALRAQVKRLESMLSKIRIVVGASNKEGGKS